MRIQGRLKRTTKQYIIVAVLCIIVIGGAAILTTIVITSQIKQEYQKLLTEANREMEQNQRNIYVATANILAGDVITKEDLVKKKVYSSQPVDVFLSEEQIGKLALINIPEGTQVLDTMVADNSISANLRETEYDVIHLNSNIEKDDTVDIRILYPNGESYVVLSKKVIKELSIETASIFLWLEAEEILRMSAGIVDASLYSGSKLYVTKYIEPNIQDASVITYTPSLSILSLIEKDPNIVDRCSQELNREVRKALENRLANSIDLDVSAISWDVPAGEFPELSANETSEVETNEEDGDEAVVDIKEDRVENIEEGKKVVGGVDSVADENENRGVDSKTDNKIDSKVDSKVDRKENRDEDELGSTDFFYYSEEQEAIERDIEYGE
ncbi:MAG: hypothetical protein K0S04_2918 [Herbinix sp.]|jgi:hypothetical protein|nr:hypothetical protein [Herbinix sp.]